MTATLARRHHITVTGDGDTTLFFLHGLGCDQGMWRFVAPAFEDRARVVKMDMVGFGRSAHGDWNRARYGGLEGHAADLADVALRFSSRRSVFVGHSIGCMIGLLADLQAPEVFDAHVMVAPSPCYRNEPGYTGGFDTGTLHQTLDLMGSDVKAWTDAMMPALLQPTPEAAHATELSGAFCRSHPEALMHLARATFLGDLRDELADLEKPTLVLQSDDDLIAPVAVGRFMEGSLRNATLRVISNQGHCPHLTQPGLCVEAIADFFDGLGLDLERRGSAPAGRAATARQASVPS